MEHAAIIARELRGASILKAYDEAWDRAAQLTSK
jgi:hypothetical protein